MRTSAIVVALLLGAVACGPSAPAPAASGVPETVRISSRVLHDGRPIKPPYACERDGDAGTSPPLSWRVEQPGVKAYAITVIDTDANDFVHWGVLNLPADTHALAAGQTDLGPGVTQVRNDFGHVGYGAPCPPAGSPHHYVVTVWALKHPVDSLDSLPDAAVARGSVTVTFQR
jgi:Raf kinase inhibitor-like YbhB/YbcL family protein